MASLYTQQSKNVRKTWLLMTVFLGVVIGIGFIFSEVYGNPNILYAFVAFSIVMNIVAYWRSDKIALSQAGAAVADEHEYRDLHNIVENLSITAGLPKPRVYIINDPAPNAFATGRDKNHAAIAVTTGILSVLNRSELEGVIAHELSHVGNRDMLVSTVAVVLAGFIAIASDVFLRSRMFSGGRSSDDNKGSGVFVIIGIVLAILAPLFATLIQLGISRKREYLADASGALLTRYPEGLANALQKISEYAQPMHRQSNAIAHLYIADPKGKKSSAFANLWQTHPPIADRIAVLLGRK